MKCWLMLRREVVKEALASTHCTFKITVTATVVIAVIVIAGGMFVPRY